MTDPRARVSKPIWRVPGEYGYAAAIDGMGAISAPLLAATCSALLALVLSASDKMRWPNLALLLLMLATASFVGSVQLTFWARRFAVTPAELLGWWPDPTSERMAELRWEQERHYARYVVWANRARWTYNGGVVALLAALPFMLLPPTPAHFLRGLVVGIATLAFLVELVWVWMAWRRPRALDPLD